MAAAKAHVLFWGPWFSCIFLSVFISATKKGTVGVVSCFSVFVSRKRKKFVAVRYAIWNISRRMWNRFRSIIDVQRAGESHVGSSAVAVLVT